MHMCCFGVIKRILKFLKSGPRICELSQTQLTMISGNLSSYNGKIPTAFNRQPRPLSELEHWKATEFRTFLLHTGFLCLDGIVKKEIVVNPPDSNENSY